MPRRDAEVSGSTAATWKPLLYVKRYPNVVCGANSSIDAEMLRAKATAAAKKAASRSALFTLYVRIWGELPCIVLTVSINSSMRRYCPFAGATAGFEPPLCRP